MDVSPFWWHVRIAYITYSNHNNTPMLIPGKMCRSLILFYLPEANFINTFSVMPFLLFSRFLSTLLPLRTLCASFHVLVLPAAMEMVAMGGASERARSLYTQTRLHGGVLTQGRVYTQKPLRTEAFLHRVAFTQRSLYTEKSCHREACTHRGFYREMPFIQRSLGTEELLHREVLT